METKKWYQSKIVLFSATVFLTVGADLLTGFLSGNDVTPDQIQAIQSAQPEVAQAVERLQAGENILQVIASLFPAIVMVLRVWFTHTPIEK